MPPNKPADDPAERRAEKLRAWVAEGKSIAEMAAALCVSSGTARQYLWRAGIRLGRPATAKRLPKAAVAKIEELVARGMGPAQIAPLVGLDYKQVYPVFRRIEPSRAIERHNPYVDRTARRYEEVVRRRKAGERPAEVAKALGISAITVTKIWSRSLRADGVPLKGFTEELTRSITQLSVAGMPTAAIARRLGLNYAQVHNFLCHRDLIKPSEQPRATPEEIAAIRDAICTGTLTTTHQLAALLSRPHPFAAYHVRKLRPALVAAGQVPICACGEPIFHGWTCSAQVGPRWGSDHKIMTTKAREEVKAGLVAGRTLSAVARDTGYSASQVTYVSTFYLTEAESRQRAFNRQRRAVPRRKGRTVPANISAGRDTLFAEIWSYVGATRDPSLRDDIVQETYLAVIEGLLPRDQIAYFVTGISNRMIRTFADDYGPSSLDEMMEGSIANRAAAMFADHTAQRMVDEMTI